MTSYDLHSDHFV